MSSHKTGGHHFLVENFAVAQPVTQPAIIIATSQTVVHLVVFHLFKLNLRLFVHPSRQNTLSFAHLVQVKRNFHFFQQLQRLHQLVFLRVHRDQLCV